MADKNLRIKISEKGARKTGRAIKGVDKSISSLGKSAVKAAGAFFGVRMLIEGFKKAGELAEKAGKAKGLSTAFENLGKTANFSARSLDKLRAATDGTMDSIGLMKEANNALLLGIVKSDDEMADLFDTAQRLAKAVGEDAAFGIQSLVTGLGRQSRMMLDNLGIIVDTNKAYEDYAKKLGKSVDGLTDAERKTAFLTSGMEQARLKAESLGPELLDASDASKEASAEMENLGIAIGEKLAPFMEAFNKDTAFAAKNLRLLIEGAKEEPRGIEKVKEEIESIKVLLGGKGDILESLYNAPKINEWELAMNSASENGIGPLELKLLKLETELLILNNGVIPKHIEAMGEFTPTYADAAETTDNFAEAQVSAWEKIQFVVRGSGDALSSFGDTFMKVAQIGSNSNKTLFNIGKAAAMGSAIINTSEAVTKALASAPPPLNFILAGSVGAAGAAEVATIASTNMKKAEFGFEGIVDKPTMFMTGEGGKKEHVSVTPLESPNINGPSGGVTINISGNVLTNDFVIDKVIPQIQKAVTMELA